MFCTSSFWLAIINLYPAGRRGFVVEIIGRDSEKEVLNRIYASKEAEFLALYGRRRVGKTHLIREYFSRKQGLYFELVGKKGGSQKEHLQLFTQSLMEAFPFSVEVAVPNSWHKALTWLTDQIEQRSKKEPVVLFFDELPWLSGRKSGFLAAIDHFWNTKWSRLPNIRLIVCGSAASWMLRHIVNAKGGLHNRITASIQLDPLNLQETECFLKSRGCRFSREQILSLFMVVGGIPHYLKQIDKGKSVVQNISRLCFQKGGLLRDEFKRLFSSLFDHSEQHEMLIRTLAKSRSGLSRKVLPVPSGGTLSKRLEELEASGFIQSFIPYGKSSRDRFYRLIDEYAIFYLRWIEPTLKSGHLVPPRYWLSQSKSPSYASWSGYAFEAVCLKHIAQIIEALGLKETACIVSSWRHVGQGEEQDGAQIDLLLDREDGAITICEIKHTASSFKLDKSYARTLLRKMDVFASETQTKKQLFLGLVSSSGVSPTSWSEQWVDHVVTLDDLFSD